MYMIFNWFLVFFLLMASKVIDGIGTGFRRPESRLERIYIAHTYVYTLYSFYIDLSPNVFNVYRFAFVYYNVGLYVRILFSIVVAETRTIKHETGRVADDFYLATFSPSDLL